MIIGMRYAIAILVLLTLACSKKESPPEASAAAETKASSEAAPGLTPTPPADPAKAAPPPSLDPPTVKLVTAGKPPLQEVRWQFSEGASEVLEMTIAQTIEMKGGGWDHHYVPISIAQTIEFSNKAVSTDGTTKVGLTVREVEALETKDANSPAIEGGKGATGTYEVDSTGIIKDLVLVGAPDSIYKGSDLDMLKGLLRLTIIPVPSEAIGVGAKWTVTQSVYEHQTVIDEQLSIELVERTASEITLRVKIEGSGSRQPDVGGRQQKISLDTDTAGRIKLRLTALVPRSSELEQRTLQLVQAEGVDDAKEELKVTIDRRVTTQSK